MKKSFRYYALVWAALLAVFNVVVFAVRSVIPGYEIHYDAHFWLAWGFIMASFVGQLVCAYLAFRAGSAKKMFMNMPLITETAAALVIMTAAGCILMLIPDCPVWVATVVCVVIFGFSVVAALKASAVAQIVPELGIKTKERTVFIRSLTADAQTLLEQARSAEIRAQVQKAFDAVRYSDPMSSDGLAGVESQITLKFAALSDAVQAGDIDAVKSAAGELTILIADRNRRCKLLK